jgi:hypothetical protein
MERRLPENRGSLKQEETGDLAFCPSSAADLRRFGVSNRQEGRQESEEHRSASLEKRVLLSGVAACDKGLLTCSSVAGTECSDDSESSETWKVSKSGVYGDCFRSMVIDGDAPVLFQYLGNNDRLLELLLKALACNSEVVLPIVEMDESSDAATVVSTDSGQLSTFEGFEKSAVLRGKDLSLIKERSKTLLEVVVMESGIVLAWQI